MALSGDQPGRQRWRWPQFSILELLLVTAASRWSLEIPRPPKRTDVGHHNSKLRASLATSVLENGTTEQAFLSIPKT